MFIFLLNMAVFNRLGFLSELFQWFPSLCLCVLFFFFTSQISLTLPKTLLSDSLLSLVPSKLQTAKIGQHTSDEQTFLLFQIMVNVAVSFFFLKLLLFFFNSSPCY